MQHPNVDGSPLMPIITQFRQPFHCFSILVKQQCSSIIADFMSAFGDVAARLKYNSLVNEDRYSDRIRRLAACILMNSLSNLVFQRRKFLWEDKERTKERGRDSERKRGAAGSGGGGNNGGRRRRRRGEPEPEMAARWLLLLLALLATHAAALPDFIRIGEYLSQFPPVWKPRPFRPQSMAPVKLLSMSRSIISMSGETVARLGFSR